MVQTLKDTILFRVYVDLRPSNLWFFNQGWFCPQGTFLHCLETVVVTTVGMLHWHLVVIGWRYCWISYSASDTSTTNCPGPDVNSTETGKPCSKPMGWVAGLSLRNLLIPCPLKHPLCVSHGRSSLICMCEVISFQTQQVLVGGGGLFFSSRILLLKENL